MGDRAGNVTSLIGPMDRPMQRDISEEVAHPNTWKRCKEAFLLDLSQGFLVVCESEESERKTRNRNLFCSSTHSITSSLVHCADVGTAQPASFPNWCRPLVQQGCAKKPLSQGFSGRHCVRSPFLGFYFLISFPSQWCCTLESTVSNSAFCSSN